MRAAISELRIQVRRGTAFFLYQQVRRRHLGSGVDPTQVIGEAANDGKPGIRPGLTALRERSPSEGRLGCQMLFTSFLDEGKELGEELLGSIELKAEGTANHKVVGESAGAACSCDVSRPRAGYRSQSITVDLSINRRCNSVTVTQQLSNLRQRCAAAQHHCRGRMAQPMSVDRNVSTTLIHPGSSFRLASDHSSPPFLFPGCIGLPASRAFVRSVAD